MHKIWLSLLIVFVGGLALLMFMAPWQAWRVDYLPLGNKGLELWLQQHNIAVWRSKRYESVGEEDLSLRIMSFPYFRDFFKGLSDDVPQMDQERFVDKIYEIPSLIILPKWHAKRLQDKVAEKAALLPLSVLNENMALVVEGLRLVRFENQNTRQFVRERVQPELAALASSSYDIELYLPQLFDPDSLPDFCRNILSVSYGSLLISCDVGQSLYFLSDPDLLNNHGLSMGDHADLSVAMLRTLRGHNQRGEEDERPIYFDSNADLLKDVWEEKEEEGKTYERNSDDLVRMFEYPLSVVWGLILLLLMVSLWRGFYRFGPPQRDVFSQVELSKTVAVEATAQLFLRSRNDRHMVAQFVHGLLLTQAARHFGVHCSNEAGIERLLVRFERRNKEQGVACRALVADLMDKTSTHHAGTRDLHRKLELLQQFIKEF